MKTPMQRLEEIILERRDHAIKNLQNYPRWSDIYETKIFFCEDILEIIDYLIQKEKDCIIDSYYEGAKGWVIEHYGDVTDYDKEEAERYYNETFNEELNE